MANFKKLVGNIKDKYKDWEAGSKEREKRKLEKIQGKRARESLQHIYKMEHARRKLELEEQLMKIKIMELKRKRATAASKKLGGGSSFMSMLEGKPKSKRR